MVGTTGIVTLEDLRRGGKRALAQALATIETHRDDPALARLLDSACAAPQGQTLGLTGPPGVGKSTLTNVLLRVWRDKGESVGVIAVDPSSQKSGGALLGDRARILTDPEDRGVFVRSMAARDRLGGLSDDTIAAMVLMRALYDHVLIESVGIGQSEADIAFASDTVLMCIQPASGDSLQFMKAGIMEIPHLIAVTKLDLGEAGRRAIADVKGALSLSAADGWTSPVLGVSANTGEGLAALAAALSQRQQWLAEGGRLRAQRRAQEEDWVADRVRRQFGSYGLGCASLPDAQGKGPFSRMHHISETMRQRFSV